MPWAEGDSANSEELTPLDRYLLRLTDKQRPSVCFIGTASGDSDRYAAKFYRAYGPVSDASDLVLFGAPERESIDHLVDRDLVFVGGGNTANMLAVWKLHKVDKALRAAWQSGTILAGISAGAICWFEACLTDSFGVNLSPVLDGLGFLTGSACPHLDGEPRRRPRYVEEVAAGRLPAGYGIDNGVALHFVGTKLHTVVSEREGGGASLFELIDGAVRETRFDATLLPAGG